MPPTDQPRYLADSAEIFQSNSLWRPLLKSTIKYFQIFGQKMPRLPCPRKINEYDKLY